MVNLEILLINYQSPVATLRNKYFTFLVCFGVVLFAYQANVVKYGYF